MKYGTKGNSDFNTITEYTQMNFIKTKVGNAEVLIETVGARNQGYFPGMEDTANYESVGDKVYNTFENVREVISGIVQEFSEEVFCQVHSPSEMKIAFSVSLSTEGKVLLVKGSSNMTLNVELTWKKDGGNE